MHKVTYDKKLGGLSARVVKKKKKQSKIDHDTPVNI